MRLFVKRNGKQQAPQFGISKNDNILDTNNNETLKTLEMNEFKLKEFFLYTEENNEICHYPSAEEDSNIEIIKQLLRHHVKEKQEFMNGHLIENIFEYPKETYEHMMKLDRERKMQAILNMNMENSASNTIGYTSSPSPTKKN